MPQTHDQNQELLVLNPAQEPVVLNTIAPELSQIPFEALAATRLSRNAMMRREGSWPSLRNCLRATIEIL
jgi:hypothetical protein